jgi:hypothetical protein
MSLYIVKFVNGKYGIMRRTFWDKIFKRNGLFRDFKPATTFGIWRTHVDFYFKDCQLDTIEQAKEQLSNLVNGYVESIIA